MGSSIGTLFSPAEPDVFSDDTGAGDTGSSLASAQAVPSDEGRPVPSAPAPAELRPGAAEWEAALLCQQPPPPAPSLVSAPMAPAPAAAPAHAGASAGPAPAPAPANRGFMQTLIGLFLPTPVVFSSRPGAGGGRAAAGGAAAGAPQLIPTRPRTSYGDEMWAEVQEIFPPHTVIWLGDMAMDGAACARCDCATHSYQQITDLLQRGKASHAYTLSAAADSTEGPLVTRNLHGTICLLWAHGLGYNTGERSSHRPGLSTDGVLILLHRDSGLPELCLDQQTQRGSRVLMENVDVYVLQRDRYGETPRRGSLLLRFTAPPPAPPGASARAQLAGAATH